MFSEAVSFCTIVVFSLAITSVWCKPADQTKSYITVAAKNPSQGGLFTDRDGQVYFSALPNVIYENRKQQQQLQQQQNQHFSEINLNGNSNKGQESSSKGKKQVSVIVKNNNSKQHNQEKGQTLNTKQTEKLSNNNEKNNQHESGSDEQQGHADYYAYPKYHFKYEVNDPKTMDKKHHFEERDGDKVTGQYALLEPDGHIRTVDYKSDKKTGFQAVVSRDGNEIEF